MQNFKPAASLSSGLLARKGMAKPAMRRQLPSLFGTRSNNVSTHDLDDLGWNDMGDEAHTPANHGLVNHGATGHEMSSDVGSKPAVIEQREALYENFGRRITFDSSVNFAPSSSGSDDTHEAEDDQDAKPEHDEENSFSLKAMRQTVASYQQASGDHSITLRLSEIRHARLQNISNSRRSSTQMIVIEAIDLYFEMLSATG